LEASVLLGRQLDFSAARYYGFMGQIENQQKEVLKQVGSLEEFNAMMPFQKEAIAKAAGMEVDQLANMLEQQKLLADMDPAKRAAYDNAIEQIGEINKKTADSILQEKQRMLAQEKFAKVWDALIYKLSSILFPLFDAIYKFIDPIANAIQEMMTGMEKGEGVFGELKSVFGELADAVGEFIPPFMNLVKLIMPVLIRQAKIFLEPIITGIRILAKVLSGDLKGAIQLLPKFFEGMIKRVINSILLIPQMFLKIIDNILGTNLTGALQSVIDWISSAWGTLQEILLWPFRAVIDIIGFLVDAFKTGWKMMDIMFFQPFRESVQWILDAANSIGDFFSGIFGGSETAEIKVTDERGETTNIPETATGGVVTTPQVRMVGEAGPEAIIPLDRAGEFSSDNTAIVSKLDELINKSDPSIVTQKLDELIKAIESMSIVMDHRKIGEILATNTSHPGLGG